MYVILIFTLNFLFLFLSFDSLIELKLFATDFWIILLNSSHIYHIIFQQYLIIKAALELRQVLATPNNAYSFSSCLAVKLIRSLLYGGFALSEENSHLGNLPSPKQQQQQQQQIINKESSSSSSSSSSNVMKTILHDLQELFHEYHNKQQQAKTASSSSSLSATQSSQTTTTINNNGIANAFQNIWNG
jgi:hypothetical protein